MHLLLPTDKGDTPDLCSLWVTLHAVYAQWSLARPDAPERGDIAGHLRRQLEGLSKISSETWSSLMSLQGMSPLGLAAYSWCTGASLKGLVSLWSEVHVAAQEAPDRAFEGLQFTNPELLPERKVSILLDTGFAHSWQMRLLSHIWAGQEVIHDIEQTLKPEIIAWFNFVKPHV